MVYQLAFEKKLTLKNGKLFSKHQMNNMQNIHNEIHKYLIIQYFCLHKIDIRN